MTTDAPSVSTENVSQAEQASSGQEVQETQNPSPALTEEKVQKMIAEATAKAVEEAKELGRRELQSQQDKNKSEQARLTRRATTAEAAMTKIAQRLQKENPNVAKDVELEMYRAQVEGQSKAEQEDTLAQQQATFHQNFLERQQKFIESLGIDPNDSRIDWAGDAKDYLEAMERIQSSVANINKENMQTMTTGLEDRLKSLEAKLTAADTEANSVNTDASGGASTTPDAKFLQDFAQGNVPLSKENIARYEKIMNES